MQLHVRMLHRERADQVRSRASRDCRGSHESSRPFGRFLTISPRNSTNAALGAAAVSAITSPEAVLTAANGDREAWRVLESMACRASRRPGPSKPMMLSAVL